LNILRVEPRPPSGVHDTEAAATSEVSSERLSAAADGENRVPIAPARRRRWSWRVDPLAVLFAVVALLLQAGWLALLAWAAGYSLLPSAS
jgi:hypothetical protein